MKYTTEILDKCTGELKTVPKYHWLDASTNKKFPFTCNSWKCEVCRPKLVKFLRYRIGDWAKEHNCQYFWTLTLDPKKINIPPELNPDEARSHQAQYINKIWNKFMTFIRRKHPDIVYICIREFHANRKYFHLHILMNKYIKYENFAGRWERYGGGKIGWVEKMTDKGYVDVQHIVRYVVKYITKMGTIDAEYYPPNCRRYTVSRCIKMRYSPAQNRIYTTVIYGRHECYHATIERTDPLPDTFAEIINQCRECVYRKGCHLTSYSPNYILYAGNQPQCTKPYEVTMNTMPFVIKQLSRKENKFRKWY